MSTDTGLLSGELRLAGGLDARFFALLQAVQQTGSISRAARTVGLSYRGAWLMLDRAVNLAQAPLLQTATGGAGGGGTRLTEAATALLDAWQMLQTEHQRFLRKQQHRLLDQHPALHGLLRRLSMKTSARNQFVGTISALDIGPVSAEVGLTLKSGDVITATLTAAAARKLQLKQGQEAMALVKASSVVLVSDFAGWQLSARNQLSGTVSRIEKAAVSCLVVLTLPGGLKISASLTPEGLDALGLAVGAPATAAFKAYSVLVATQG
jgi:molybdate transport system regulatory protein